MAKIHHEIYAENTRMAGQQVQINEEVEDLKAQAGRLERQRVASYAMQ